MHKTKLKVPRSLCPNLWRSLAEFSMPYSLGGSLPPPVVLGLLDPLPTFKSDRAIDFIAEYYFFETFRKYAKKIHRSCQVADLPPVPSSLVAIRDRD